MDLKGEPMKIEMNVPNVNRGDLSETMIIEEEVRNFIRRPICRPHMENEELKFYLQPAKMSVVTGNDSQGDLQVWTCPKCDYSVRLPAGMFPEPSFVLLRKAGPMDDDNVEEQ